MATNARPRKVPHYSRTTLEAQKRSVASQLSLLSTTKRETVVAGKVLNSYEQMVYREGTLVKQYEESTTLQRIANTGQWAW